MCNPISINLQFTIEFYYTTRFWPVGLPPMRPTNTGHMGPVFLHNKDIRNLNVLKMCWTTFIHCAITCPLYFCSIDWSSCFKLTLAGVFTYYCIPVKVGIKYCRYALRIIYLYMYLQAKIERHLTVLQFPVNHNPQSLMEKLFAPWDRMESLIMGTRVGSHVTLAMNCLVVPVLLEGVKVMVLGVARMTLV